MIHHHCRRATCQIVMRTVSAGGGASSCEARCGAAKIGSSFTSAAAAVQRRPLSSSSLVPEPARMVTAPPAWRSCCQVICEEVDVATIGKARTVPRGVWTGGSCR